MYHYTDSGLKNIRLVNGYKVKKTPYGEAVAIEDLEGLHKEIGKWLVKAPKALTGAEFRFLRHELDMSQKKLGQILGKSEQAVGRWERSFDKPVEPTADRFMRVIYSEYAGGSGTVKALIEQLCELDKLEHSECRLEERNGRWRIAGEARAA